MCWRPGQKGVRSTFLSRSILADETGFQLGSSWRQWRPVLASEWINIMSSFRGHLRHLHENYYVSWMLSQMPERSSLEQFSNFPNHYVLLNSQKFWMFSQMPPAVQMSATLPPLKIHHRCPLAYSPRLLL